VSNATFHNKWTEEKIDILRRMVAANHTSKQISNAIEGTSPVAIRNKARRLGLYVNGGTFKNKINLPENSIPTELVRKDINEFPNESVRAGSLRTGISLGSFRIIRRILVLQSSPDPTRQEKEKLKEALDHINTNFEVSHADTITKDIVSRYWTKKTTTGLTRKQSKRREKMRESLDNMLFRVREICSSTEDLIIPSLETEARLDAIRLISQSMMSLNALLNKIGEEDDKPA
jgi:hypothetical protein